jgi:tripartite-type tricarboxylate transporter receptor subunit TctC
MNLRADKQSYAHSLTRRRALAMLACAAALPTGVLAQSDRPVRIIVPTSAGAALDAVVRAAQPALARALGTPLVIDNQAGAGGQIGLQALARSSPDGSVLGMSSNSMVILPSVMKAFQLDVSKDFTHISIVGAIPMVVVVNPSKVAATNAKEFIALLRSKSDALSFGSSGPGGVLHLATAMLLDEVGVKVSHIPYKGVAPLVTDLVGGQVDFAVVALPVAQPYMKSGALRAIGVCSAQRVSIAPEIPTFVEQGLPNYAVDAWVSVVGPKGMTPALVKKVHAAVVSAFNDPVVKDAMVKQGTVVNVSTPEEAQATVHRDLAKFAALAKKINLEPQ